jgi:hypothetical protein
LAVAGEQDVRARGSIGQAFKITMMPNPEMHQSEPLNALDAAELPPPTTAGDGGRWLRAIAAGLLVGVPVSVLLSFAGLLPFYLGPFFFLLFGLAVGAGVFRVARPMRPVWRVSACAAAAAVIIPIFLASLRLEYAQLGPHAGKMVAKKVRELPPGMSPRQFRRTVGKKLREQITAEYPGSGLLAYICWAATSGRCELNLPAGAHPPTATYILSQSPVGWTLRVLVSLILLTGAVLSQVLPLGKPEPGSNARNGVLEYAHSRPRP